MLTVNRQFLTCCLLVLIAIILLAYGLALNSKRVFPQNKDDSAAFVKSEPALIREVSRGGLGRDELGYLRLTYKGKPPNACPT